MERSDRFDGSSATPYSLPETDMAGRSVVSFISHEIGNPVSAIKGFLDVILGGKAGPLSPLQLELLGMAKVGAVRLCYIVDDVSDLGLAARNAFRLDLEDTRFEQVLARAIGHLRPLAKSKQISLENSFPKGTPVCRLDSRRMEKALFSIGSQVVRFASVGSRISISGDVLESRISLFVGGIQANQLPVDYIQVLREDLDTPQSDARPDAALLGLRVTKYVVKCHGGKLWLDQDSEGAAQIGLSIPMAGSS